MPKLEQLSTVAGSKLTNQKITATSSLSNRVVRIFVSSTFADFYSEREVLTNKKGDQYCSLHLSRYDVL